MRHCAVENPPMLQRPADSTPPLAAPPQIVVVGGANLDVTAGADGSLSAGDSTPGLVGYSAGGVARNVAENLARLGHTVGLVSLVGDDAFGRTVIGASEAAGVDTSHVQALAGFRTATYVSVHGPQGDMALAVNDMTILEQLTPRRLEPRAGLLRTAQAVVLDANLSPDVLAYLFGLHGLPPIVVDGVSVAKCVRLVPWLARIALLKVNRMEAQALLGQSVASAADARAAAHALQSRGPQRVVVSLGEQGLVWCDASGRCGVLPARAVKVVNTSGAGDALLAGLVHGYLEKSDLEASARFGNACAAMTVTSALANHPDMSVRAVLDF